MLKKCVCFLVFFVTRLKGDLAEHHPDVSKLKAAAEGLCPAAVESYGHIASTRVFVVQHRLEYLRLRLPAGNEAGLKPTGNGGKNLHATGEHVVTVNLEEQMGWSVCHNSFWLTHQRTEFWSAELKPNMSTPSWRWSYAACQKQTPFPRIPECPASRFSSPDSRSPATRGTDESPRSRPGQSRRPSAGPSPQTASCMRRQWSDAPGLKQRCGDECALDPPSLVHSVVGGVIETGNGRAGGHHELTLRSAVRNQSICGRVNTQNNESDMLVMNLDTFNHRQQL